MDEIEERKKTKIKQHLKGKKVYKNDFTNLRIDFAKIGISIIYKFNGIVRENFFIFFDKITMVAILTA